MNEQQLATLPAQQIVDVSKHALSIEAIVAQRDLIKNCMAKAMKEGEHYGKIPGCGDKPTLLQPGAQLLSHLFRLRPEYEIIESDLPTDHKRFRVTCRLYVMGSTPPIPISEGVGESSSMESKHRFRSAAAVITPTGDPVPSTYWDIKHKQGPDAAKKWASTAYEGKHVSTKKIDGEWQFVIVEGGSDEKVENTNPADVFNCVTPDTRVLTHDLRWVPAGEIETGEMLIGVEESMTDRYTRNLSLGEATVYGTKVDDIYELTFEDGRSVRCNAEHRWLVKKIGLKGTEWIETRAIHQEIAEKIGRPRHWSVMSICHPWKEEQTKEAGYLAGLLDADGSLATNQIITLFAQQDNCVLARMEAGLESRGFSFGKGNCESAISKEYVYGLRVRGGLMEQMRLMGMLRPPRLLERWLNLVNISGRRLEGKGSGAGSPARIVGIRYAGKEEIVLLGSSCGTYIAEGLVAHNTVLKIAKKRAFVDATITATASSDFFTQDLEDIRENVEAVKREEKSANANEVPTNGEHLNGWRDVICTFGKAKGPLRGKKLGDLNESNLKYLCEMFLVEGKEIKPADRKMVAALAIWKEEAKPKVAQAEKWNGPNHEKLAECLAWENPEISHEDFMAALKDAKLIPAEAKSFSSMSNETAKIFLDDYEVTKQHVRNWQAKQGPAS